MNYIITNKKLGKGFQGVVYEAEVEYRGKIIPAAAKKFRNRDQIAHELKMTKLAKTAAPKIYGLVEIDNNNYILMERVNFVPRGESYYEGDIRKIERMITKLAKRNIVNGDGDFAYRMTGRGTEWVITDWGAGQKYNKCTDTKMELAAWAQGAPDMYREEIAAAIIKVCEKFKCREYLPNSESYVCKV